MQIGDVVIGTLVLWRDRHSKEVILGTLTAGPAKYEGYVAVMQHGSCLMTQVLETETCIPLMNRSDVTLSLCSPETAVEHKGAFQSMLKDILR